MGRIGENCFYISALYHAAAVHNGNIIADLCNDAKIMCNKQDGCTCLFFQLIHQIQNLCLNRYIQCSRRLIRNQDFRLTYKCHGNHDPLSLAAGKLERILLHHMLHTRQNAFCHLVSNLHDRIQTGHRFLENHGNFASAQLSLLFLRQLYNVIAIQQDFAISNFSFRSGQ